MWRHIQAGSGQHTAGWYLLCWQQFERTGLKQNFGAALISYSVSFCLWWLLVSGNFFLSAVSCQDGKESWAVAVLIIINTCLSCQLKQWVLHPRRSVWWIQYRENIFSRQIQWHKRDVGHWAYWPLYLKRWHLKSTVFIFSCLRGLQPTFICLRLYFSTLQCAQGNDDMNLNMT